MEPLSSAIKYAQAGLSVIPTTRSTKAPTIPSWAPNQQTPASPQQLQTYFLKPGADSLAIVAGEVSGALECIDFDFQARLFTLWRELVEKEAPGLLAKLVIQKTQSGGLHAVYRCREIKIPGNQKLAKAMEGGSPRTFIETRGEGGYFLVSPSQGYEIRQGSFLEIPDISVNERDVLIRCAKALNSVNDKKVITGRGQTMPDASRPGDDFNERGDPIPMLLKHGWELCSGNGKYQHLTRPGKDKGVSASIIDSKVFHVFTTNADPFENDESYSPFAVLAILEHNGDFKAAAKALAKQGYGQAKREVEKRVGPEPKITQRFYPEIEFPWTAFPEDLAESFKQFGKSFATDPEPIAIYSLSYIAAAVGRSAMIKGKDGWIEPLILWFLEVGDSGTGKTPKMRALGQSLERLQIDEHRRYEDELEAFEKLPAKEQKEMERPGKPRAYFSTGYTMEGLSADLHDHPTGGMVVLLNEASVMISGQNQYKKGGTDRESLLALWDGRTARISRAKGALMIEDPRIQIIGGIQPSVFKRIFTKEDYQTDGTIYRCLIYAGRPEFHALTEETWKGSDSWEKVLASAYNFGNAVYPVYFELTELAWINFRDWRNKLTEFNLRVPDSLKGFLPKLVSYCLRFAGLLQLLETFRAGKAVAGSINADVMIKAISLSNYFIGQAETALTVLKDGSVPKVENVLVEAINNFMADKGQWEGGTGDLLKALPKKAGVPKNAVDLGRRLKNLEAHLLQHGIEISYSPGKFSLAKKIKR